MDTQIARKTVDQFRAPKRSLGPLDADAAAKLIAASSDVALVVDNKGIIRDVAFGSDELAREGYQAWVGKLWVDTVTIESRSKVEALLRDAAASSPRWRQVNHPAAQGSDVPVRYSAVQVGDNGRVVAVGRDLRSVAALQQKLVNAQQTMEREYTRLRQSETRYRLLFEVSSEAVLVADVGTLKIVEINPACAEFIGKPAKKLIGTGMAQLFDGANARRLQKHVDHVAAVGRTDEIKLRLAEGKRDVIVGASLFRQDGASFFLVRLLDAAGDISAKRETRSHFSDVVERLPDAFVVTDERQRIISANTAFIELAQAASLEQLRGEPIDRWLGRQSIDVNILFGSLREHGVIRAFSTVFRGQFGLHETVEVAGAAVTDTDVPCFGLSIRTVQRRHEPIINHHRSVPRSVEQLTGLVGQVSLKELVRESTDLIEKLCIEAALELTGDNRASAAEMLGLSRQGLYSKLRRYGIADSEGANDP
ncbi:MAG: transcriptional regulator PpsR [Hyphomicrobiaceae bacterium]|nr:transcriptional regulator PpsR [Hyphomicrobiaceae bacterium]